MRESNNVSEPTHPPRWPDGTLRSSNNAFDGYGALKQVTPAPLKRRVGRPAKLEPKVFHVFQKAGKV